MEAKLNPRFYYVKMIPTWYFVLKKLILTNDYDVDFERDGRSFAAFQKREV
jgi:hypothetical protein